VTVVCAAEFGLDRPSTLDQRFLDAAVGRTVYVHAMHRAVGWGTFAVWGPDGELRRSLSVSPDSGVMEDIGEPLAFERAYWAGEHPAEGEDADPSEDPYPLPFHPLELAEEALVGLFGFCLEGPPTFAEHGTLDPGDIPLAAFTLTARKRRLFGGG
jgi:hypothetical protein